MTIKPWLVCSISLMIFGACAGDLSKTPDSTNGDADLQAQVDALAARSVEWGVEPISPFSIDENEASQAICELTVVESCPARVAICEVRCCDGFLDKSPQVCGNCAEWAAGVCANHDTRRHIRWSCPCSG